MKEIHLANGRGVALVDDQDYERTSKHRWYYCRGYAIASVGGVTTGMHRMVVDAPKGMDVDHINGDKLDNRRANLRMATRSQNMANRRGAAAHNRLGVRGVTSDRGCAYVARIRVQGKLIIIGRFKEIESAAAAHRQALQKYFGEFAA